LCDVSFLLRGKPLKIQVPPNIKSPWAIPIIVSRLSARSIRT
jgi:hypothetical protein